MNPTAPSMTPAGQLDLSPWSSYPTGTDEAWRQRYQSLVKQTESFEPPASPALSVIVVAWNSPGFVLEALDHILLAAQRLEHPIEIILVDNGGLESALPGIRARVHTLIRMVGNVRLCRARNYAAACASAPLIVFLDDDGLVHEDHLFNAHRWFDSRETCAIHGRVVFKNHRYFTTLAQHYDLGDEALEDCLMTEGNMAIRRETFIGAGGFNETLAGNEGLDLTFRIKQQDPDSRVLYVPDVVLRHDFIDSWAKFRRKFSHYAGIDQQVTALDPGLGPFLDAYRKVRPHPRRLAGTDRLAQWLLTKIKKRLQRKARRAVRRI